VQSECQEFERSPMAWAKWIELRETLAKFQSERGKKTSDDNGSDDMISKAERKWKSDASPMEFCRRGLAVGNLWDSLADLLKITKLREVGADDEKEVQEIVQHLFTNILSLHVVSKIANRQRHTSTTCCLSSLSRCTPYWTQSLSGSSPRISTGGN